MGSSKIGISAIIMVILTPWDISDVKGVPNGPKTPLLSPKGPKCEFNGTISPPMVKFWNKSIFRPLGGIIVDELPENGTKRSNLALLAPGPGILGFSGPNMA